MELLVEQERLDNYKDNLTGIFVRAKFPNGKWDNADICWLSKKVF